MALHSDNHYLGKFSETGKPEGFVLEKVHYRTPEEKQKYLDEGYVEVSQEDWDFYVGNNGNGDNGTGYIRDPETGTPVSAPAKVYTQAELANIAYSVCNSVVTRNEDTIAKYTALGYDEEMIQELRDEISAAEAKYADDLAKIESGEYTKPSDIYGKTEGEEEV